MKNETYMPYTPSLMLEGGENGNLLAFDNFIFLKGVYFSQIVVFNFYSSTSLPSPEAYK